jgi:hypothetical protein
MAIETNVTSSAITPIMSRAFVQVESKTDAAISAATKETVSLGKAYKSVKILSVSLDIGGGTANLAPGAGVVDNSTVAVIFPSSAPANSTILATLICEV